MLLDTIHAEGTAYEALGTVGASLVLTMGYGGDCCHRDCGAADRAKDAAHGFAPNCGIRAMSAIFAFAPETCLSANHPIPVVQRTLRAFMNG